MIPTEDEMSLAIVIPTCGRWTLARTLLSVQNAGVDSSDEVLVVGDGPQPVAERICRDYHTRGVPVIYMDGPTTHGFGGAQRNFGMDAATHEHFLFMDDDDEYVEGCFPDVRKVIAENPGQAILARMRHRSGVVIWADKAIRAGNVGSQMLIVPNVRKFMARWSDEYVNDYRFISGVAEKGMPVFWWDRLIAIHHPCPEDPSRR
jgi:glycosyltransferase involved in cell wall biosynthesis